MPTALVTGATGLVGSHIVERLSRDGWRLRALVRDTKGVRQPSCRWDGLAWLRERGVELAAGDILDLPSFVDAARGREVIFHTAAVVTPRASRIHPYDAYRIPNVEVHHCLGGEARRPTLTAQQRRRVRSKGTLRVE